MQISTTDLSSSIIRTVNPDLVRPRSGAAAARPATTLTDSATTPAGDPAPEISDAAPVAPEEPSGKVKVKLKVKVKEGHHEHGPEHSKGHEKGKGHDPRVHVKLKAQIGDEKLHLKFKETLDEGAAASLVESLRDEVGDFLSGTDASAYESAVTALVDEFEAAVSSGPAPEGDEGTTDVHALATTIEDALATFAAGLQSILAGEVPETAPPPAPLPLPYVPTPEGGAVVPGIGDEPVLDPSLPLGDVRIDVLA